MLFAILAKLFNIIMSVGYVPYGFRLSYTVPLPKVDSEVIPTLLIQGHFNQSHYIENF